MRKSTILLLILVLGVDRFPVLERDKEPNTNSIERVRAQLSSGPNSVKLQDHNHNREVVFALPSLRLHFKTEHVQGPHTPESTGTLLFIFNSNNSLKYFTCRRKASGRM